MYHYLSADYLYPIVGDPLPNGVLVYDEDGLIIDILPSRANLTVPVHHYEGIVCPGLVNTHCHLELSYLKEKIPPHTGLIGFVQEIQKIRNLFSEQEIQQAIVNADEEMYANGVVAVGDIANTLWTKEVKQKSKIDYHTFVEIFGFLPNNACEKLASGLDLQRQFAPLTTSLVPHAPYSVSKPLFDLLAEHNQTLYSIHNQETSAENLWYEQKKGNFVQFYENFGMEASFFEPSQKTSLQTVADYFPSKAKILLVHNSFSVKADVDYVKKQNLDVYWALCPCANLYIENVLPAVLMLIEQGCKITLGTDSLASNHGLSIWDEILALKQAFPSIEIKTMLQWATLNGATYLGIESKYGSFEKGKQPGIVWINHQQKIKRIR